MTNAKPNKAACKRALIMGAKFTFQFNLPKERGGNGEWSTPQYREVTHVQTNSVAMAKTAESVELAKANPHKNATWLYFDQKDDKGWYLRDDGTIEIIAQDGYTMRYQPIKD